MACLNSRLVTKNWGSSVSDAYIITCQPSRILQESPAFSIKFFKNPALTISPVRNGHSPIFYDHLPPGNCTWQSCVSHLSPECHASPPGDRQWPPIKVIKTVVEQSTSWLHNLIDYFDNLNGSSRPWSLCRSLSFSLSLIQSRLYSSFDIILKILQVII